MSISDLFTVHSWSRRTSEINDDDTDGRSALPLDLHSDNFIQPSDGSRKHSCGNDSDQEGTWDVTFATTRKRPRGQRTARNVGSCKTRAYNISTKAHRTKSRNDGVASSIENKDNRQSHHCLVTSAAGYLDSADITPPERHRSASRSGDSDLGNLANTFDGEWRIHGIIGKEVIGGEIHYCVDWYPTFVPESELGKARRFVQEFEAKEEAEHRKMGHTQGKKPRGRPRKRK